MSEYDDYHYILSQSQSISSNTGKPTYTAAQQQANLESIFSKQMVEDMKKDITKIKGEEVVPSPESSPNPWELIEEVIDDILRNPTLIEQTTIKSSYDKERTFIFKNNLFTIAKGNPYFKIIHWDKESLRKEIENGTLFEKKYADSYVSYSAESLSSPIGFNTKLDNLYNCIRSVFSKSYQSLLQLTGKTVNIVKTVDDKFTDEIAEKMVEA